MKLTLGTAAVVCVVLVAPAFANGPGMMEQPAQTNTQQNNPQRQKWVRHRLHQLEGNHQHYENEKFRAKLLMNPMDGQLSDIAEIAKFKAWEAANKPQRHKERVETLMLKRENGTITPAENAALNKWIRQHTKHK